MKILKNKYFAMLIATIIMLLILCLTGCNKQIIDLDYNYNKAICNIGGEVKEIEIKKWKDYDGEQIQIKDKKGNTYLVSMNNCTLINE